MKQWTETKREYFLRQDNVVKKVTEEFIDVKAVKRNTVIDLVVKGAGLTAIFIPVLLFYLQYNGSLIEKRSEDFSNLYVDIQRDVFTIENSAAGNASIHAGENLRYKYSSEIALYKDRGFQSNYNNLLDRCNFVLELRATVRALVRLDSAVARVMDGIVVSRKADGSAIATVKGSLVAEKIQQIRDCQLTYGIPVGFSKYPLTDNFYRLHQKNGKITYPNPFITWGDSTQEYLDLLYMVLSGDGQKEVLSKHASYDPLFITKKSLFEYNSEYYSKLYFYQSSAEYSIDSARVTFDKYIINFIRK